MVKNYHNISKICSVSLSFYNHEFKKAVLCAHLFYMNKKQHLFSRVKFLQYRLGQDRISDCQREVFMTNDRFFRVTSSLGYFLTLPLVFQYVTLFSLCLFVFRMKAKLSGAKWFPLLSGDHCPFYLLSLLLCYHPYVHQKALLLSEMCTE